MFDEQCLATRRNETFEMFGHRGTSFDMFDFKTIFSPMRRSSNDAEKERESGRVKMRKRIEKRDKGRNSEKIVLISKLVPLWFDKKCFIELSLSIRTCALKIAPSNATKSTTTARKKGRHLSLQILSGSGGPVRV